MIKHQTILTLISLCFIPLISSSCQKSNVEAVNSTILKCIQKNGQWVTIAKRGTVKSDALLVWNTTEFGDNCSPSERCRRVSEKLTTFVIANI